MSETEEYYDYGGDDGGPAFPTTHKGEMPSKGMSLRAYAAIHLRVPVSGYDWLDTMICRSRTESYAGQALSGIIADERFFDPELMGNRREHSMTKADVAADLAVQSAMATENLLFEVECGHTSILRAHKSE